jgi:hypothetical protein
MKTEKRKKYYQINNARRSEERMEMKMGNNGDGKRV